MSEKNHPLISKLTELVNTGDRANLALLRRGAKQSLEDNYECYKVIGPCTNSENGIGDETLFYVAVLFALAHRGKSKFVNGKGNLGDSFRKLCLRNGKFDKDMAKPIERKFMRLLDSDRKELFMNLCNSLGLLSSNSINIDWDELLNDFRYWSLNHRHAQKRWASAFWK